MKLRSKSYFHRFEFTKLVSFSGVLQNAWTWIATLRVCSFFFFCEFHDFLICSDAKTHSPLDCGILSSASATIWKSHAGKPLSKFTSTFFLSSSNCTFIVYHKRSSPTPFMLSILTSHFTQPSCTRNNNGPIIRCVRNPPIRKRSHISLQFCWISGQAFGALIPRWSRQMVNTQWVGQLQCMQATT